MTIQECEITNWNYGIIKSYIIELFGLNELYHS